MSFPIFHYNDPILKKKGEAIADFDDALRQMADNMIVTMHDARGIGLAAQQIGIARQICVMDLRETDLDFDWILDGAHPPAELFMPMVLVNPEITVATHTDSYLMEEGCLSFPDIRGDVTRPDEITVKYQDQHGVPHELTCNGLLARCVQHEVDHLNGTLFIDRMKKRDRNRIDDAIKKLAQTTKAIDEVA